MAHIGVIRALEERGVRPDMVVGTSMGAVIGAMYASGYSSFQIDSMAEALPLDAIVPGFGPRLSRPLNERPALVALEHGPSGWSFDLTVADEQVTHDILTAALSRGNGVAAGDFDRLEIPFRAVATELGSLEPVVLDGGDLVRAVRASISLPFVFRPVQSGPHTLVDGGLSASEPVGIARELGARTVIVSDALADIALDEVNIQSPTGLLSVLANRVSRQPEDIGPNDVHIRIAVEGVDRLDFSTAQRELAVDLGYRLAATALESAPCIGGQGSHGGTGQAGAASGREIGGSGRLLRSHDWRPSVARNGAPDPGFSGRGTVLTARLEAAEPEVRSRVAALGSAWSNELGPRLWLGLASRCDARVSLSAIGTIGRLRQEVEVGLRARRNEDTVLALVATGGSARERIRGFDELGEELPGTEVWVGRGALDLEFDLGRGWTVAAGPRALAWSQPADDHRVSVGAEVAVARYSVRRLTSVEARATVTTAHKRLSLDGMWPLRARGFAATLGVRLGWGTSLPLHETFSLGGSEGFPGLHVGEVRGDSEVFVRLTSAPAVWGPLRLRLEVASASATHVASLDARSIWGSRVGLGVDTWFGPVAVEYGQASNGRAAWLMRIGWWF